MPRKLKLTAEWVEDSITSNWHLIVVGRCEAAIVYFSSLNSMWIIDIGTSYGAPSFYTAEAAKAWVEQKLGAEEVE